MIIPFQPFTGQNLKLMLKEFFIDYFERLLNEQSIKEACPTPLLKLCNVMMYYVLVCFVLYYVPSAVMLRVPILRSCGILLCIVNTLSGQCVAPVNVSVICYVLCDYYVLCA